MGVTPRDLYRVGNAATARFDVIRPDDIDIYTVSGVDWVQAGTGGISTFASLTPRLKGKWWKLPAGSNFDDTVLRVE
jgi:hypothetical protein